MISIADRTYHRGTDSGRENRHSVYPSAGGMRYAYSRPSSFFTADDSGPSVATQGP
jgi:hypothetical protein